MNRCPDCGREVKSIFDHLVVEDCTTLDEEELVEALKEAEGLMGS